MTKSELIKCISQKMTATHADALHEKDIERSVNQIIQKLIDLVEHYGNCYNHDLTAYHEYRVAKKYMEDKNV